METTQPLHEQNVFICVHERTSGNGISCSASDSESIAVALKTAVQNAGQSKRIRVSRTHCLGLCSQGPNVLIFPDNIWLQKVDLSSIPAILEKLGIKP